jgi:hypothetical protein
MAASPKRGEAPRTPQYFTTELTENTEVRAEVGRRNRDKRSLNGPLSRGAHTPDIYLKWGAGASPASVPISVFSVSSVVDKGDGVWGRASLSQIAVS